jgi:hypothetical protein
MLGMPVDPGTAPMREVGLVTCARAKHRFAHRRLADMLSLMPNLLKLQVADHPMCNRLNPTMRVPAK